MAGDRVEPYPTDEQVRLAVARITGVVKRYAEGRDAARDRALLAIGVIGRPLTDAQLKEAFLHSLAHFMIGGPECWYRDEAVRFILSARGDLDTAEEIAAMRRARQPIQIGDALLG